MQELLRKIPKLDELLCEPKIKSKILLNGRDIVVKVLRKTIDEIRSGILNNKIKNIDDEFIVNEFIEKFESEMSLKLKKVVNGTGIIIHTNLGRSLLSTSSIENVIVNSKNYINLEYNLKDGLRGERYSHIGDILSELTGAESSMVVNNNAAAALLILDTFGKGKEAIVSRGELVEIGGSFRIPEIMKLSGVKLCEVGTTNKTNIEDYKNAVTEETSLILKVHTSNFKIYGFTEEVSISDLSKISEAKGIPLVHDIGSGVLINLEKYGLDHEMTVRESIEAGADLVCFSGDKLLGGPQAGIIVGKREYIEKMKKNQLTRALRIDKLTLSALEATLKEYFNEEEAINNIPTLRMMTENLNIVYKRAEDLYERIVRLNNNYDVSLDSGKSMIGGGSLPEETIDTHVIKVKSKKISTSTLEKRLRENYIPIIARIENDEIIFDLRTMFSDDLYIVEDCLEKVGDK